MLLRRGDRGPAVADLREALASLQLLPSLNGTDRAIVEFDAATDGAIRNFQQRRGLIVDGIVGPVTVRSLTDARWTLGDRALTHTLSAPMTGDDVMALQTRLAEMGYNTGRPDGIFGPLTDACVRDFQRHRGPVRGRGLRAGDLPGAEPDRPDGHRRSTAVPARIPAGPAGRAHGCTASGSSSTRRTAPTTPAGPSATSAPPTSPTTSPAGCSPGWSPPGWTSR